MRLVVVALIASLWAAAAVAVEPEDPRLRTDPQYLEAVRLIKAGEYRQAIGVLRQLDRDFPREPEVLNWLGFAHRKLKDYPTSKRYYDDALRIDPNYRPALEYQGMWFIEMGDIPSAKANLDRLRRICRACEETRDLEDALRKVGHDPA